MYKMTEKEKIDLLSRLISFKSVNNGELEIAAFIKQLFSAHGIESEILPITEKRSNLVAEIGQGGPVIAISGHMDVVSEVDANLWDTDPFSLVEKEGNLYGRGTADMKSGLAAMVIAMIELKENDLLKNGTIRFMATVGEEVGGYGSRWLFENGYTDDIDALIIGEPSGHEIIYAHKGSIDIRLISKGEAAHSSIPEMGYNALNPLLEILTQARHIFESVREENPELGKLTYNATIFNSGDQVNSIPDIAVAEMNARTIPEYDNERVIEVLQALVDKENEKGSSVEMDVYMSEDPVVKAKDNDLTNLAQLISKKYLGINFDKKVSPGVTDASNLLANHKEFDFPFMMYGPGNYKIAHKINEFVAKDEYLAFSDIYVDLLSLYLNKLPNA
ncbi:MAG: ArgE/DapE family deacylase [Aerococcus sp.]|nr:ArgE/DapE family deacylase [Aerococcus sp.]